MCFTIPRHHQGSENTHFIYKIFVWTPDCMIYNDRRGQPGNRGKLRGVRAGAKFGGVIQAADGELGRCFA